MVPSKADSHALYFYRGITIPINVVPDSPTPSIPEFGGLITGVNASTPYIPSAVTEKVHFPSRLEIVSCFSLLLRVCLFHSYLGKFKFVGSMYDWDD